jgi:hypothetical protein
VTPDYAPASNDYGGHSITVRGSNFAPVGNALICEFGTVTTVHASFINGSAMNCNIAASLVPGDIQVPMLSPANPYTFLRSKPSTLPLPGKHAPGM